MDSIMRKISQKALADAFLGDYPQNLSKYTYMDPSGRCLTVFVAIETALTIGQADMLRE